MAARRGARVAAEREDRHAGIEARRHQKRFVGLAVNDPLRRPRTTGSPARRTLHTPAGEPGRASTDSVCRGIRQAVSAIGFATAAESLTVASSVDGGTHRGGSVVDNGGERTALVIGGASGIGWATAKALAADGSRSPWPTSTVTALRHARPSSARRTPAPRSKSPTRTRWPHCSSGRDRSTSSSCTAGFSNISLIVDMPVDQFRSVVDVCLTGSLIVAKYAGRRLRETVRWCGSRRSTAASPPRA